MRQLIILMTWLSLCFVSTVIMAGDLCGFPGRDGDGKLSGQINQWFASAENSQLAAGARIIPLAPDQGIDRHFQNGDLALLIQMQGAEINSSNTDGYGNGIRNDQAAAGWMKLQAGQFEFLRIDAVLEDAVQIRGDGPGAGIRFNYASVEPKSKSADGRRRWQLVRVPQFENATLEGNITAMPWNGYKGGVIAVDVRGKLYFQGHTFDAAQSGFRGGGPVNLVGALGDNDDWRYRAPLRDELAVGFGHHASKGEGVAGTPRWLLIQERLFDTLPQVSREALSDGYPNGSMGRGAPGNAGGGGNSLSLDNLSHSGGGGGGGGLDGETGLDDQAEPLGGQGGAGLAVNTPRLLLGGGGGAGARHQGKVPESGGGIGGGIVLLRAGTLVGPGVIDVSGQDGYGSDFSGGGGGGAGSVMVLAAFEQGDDIKIKADGGIGGKAAAKGGQGGAGRLLAGGGVAFSDLPFPSINHLQPGRLPGVGPAYQCRPTGMLISGMVLEDNGAGGGTPHDGIRQQDEPGLADWQVAVSDQNQRVLDQVKTNRVGQFALELPATEANQELNLEVSIEQGWWPVLAKVPDLPLVPFEYQGEGRWRFRSRSEYLQDGIVLSLVKLPNLALPESRNVKAGSTQMFLYRYLAETNGQVRLRYTGDLSGANDWLHTFFLDKNCDDGTEFVDRGETRWIDFQANEAVCVRVRVEVPASAKAGSLNMKVEAETRLTDVPALQSPPDLDASLDIRLQP